MPAFNIQKSPDVQNEDARTVGDWAEAQFETLIADLQKHEVLGLTDISSAPLRPQTGNLIYADGVNWSPGYGEGLYYRNAAGSWEYVMSKSYFDFLIAALNLSQYMKLAGNQQVTGGFSLQPYNRGTLSGSSNINPLDGNYQYATNGGAITLNAPSVDCAIDLLLTNGASAGAVTFSGFTVNSNVGEALTTTNGHKFIISIRRINGTSTYLIKALQ